MHFFYAGYFLKIYSTSDDFFLYLQMSPKKWSKNTFGWARAEVLGALVNSVFLVALCFSIFVESMKRFYQVEDIYNPQLILIVGTMGLVVNLIGLLLFHGKFESNVLLCF